MTTPITPAECRELAEMLGIKWHHIAPPTISNPWLTCTCGATFSHLDDAIQHQNRNPDFTDAREVLKVMMAREDYGAFMESLRQKADRLGIGSMAYMVDLLTDETGLLLDEAIAYLEGMGKSRQY